MTASISPASIACCSGPPLASRRSTPCAVTSARRARGGGSPGFARHAERKQYLGLVAQVAHDVGCGPRSQLGEARRDENPFGHGAPRMLEHIDDFPLVDGLAVLAAHRLAA